MVRRLQIATVAAVLLMGCGTIRVEAQTVKVCVDMTNAAQVRVGEAVAFRNENRAAEDQLTVAEYVETVIRDEVLRVLAQKRHGELMQAAEADLRGAQDTYEADLFGEFACCLPDGSCRDLIQRKCHAIGTPFVDSLCAATTCPTTTTTLP